MADYNRVYLLAGPVGSGKSTVGRIIEKEYNGSTAHFEMSDFVRNAYYAAKGGSSISDNGLGEWAAEQKDGDLGYFGQRLARTLDTDSKAPDCIIVSGIRSPEEVVPFRTHFDNVTTLAVWTLPDIRFERKYGEMPSDTHEMWEPFMERNERELDEWGCQYFYNNASISRADQIVPNNGGKEKLRRTVRRVLAGDDLPYPFPHADAKRVRQYL